MKKMVEKLEQTAEFLNKEFGSSCISRLMCEYIFVDCHIDMDYVNDEQMEKLVNCAESQFRNKYPNVADDLFAVWTRKKPESEVLVNHKKMYNEYLRILKKYAVKFGGVLVK